MAWKAKIAAVGINQTTNETTLDVEYYYEPDPATTTLSTTTLSVDTPVPNSLITTGRQTITLPSDTALDDVQNQIIQAGQTLRDNLDISQIPVGQEIDIP